MFFTHPHLNAIPSLVSFNPLMKPHLVMYRNILKVIPYAEYIQLMNLLLYID